MIYEELLITMRRLNYLSLITIKTAGSHYSLELSRMKSGSSPWHEFNGKGTATLWKTTSQQSAASQHRNGVCSHVYLQHLRIQVAMYEHRVYSPNPIMWLKHVKTTINNPPKLHHK